MLLLVGDPRDAWVDVYGIREVSTSTGSDNGSREANHANHKLAEKAQLNCFQLDAYRRRQDLEDRLATCQCILALPPLCNNLYV